MNPHDYLQQWRADQQEDRAMSADYAFVEFLARTRYRNVRHERPRTLLTLMHLAHTYPAWQAELYRYVEGPRRRVEAVSAALRGIA